MLNAQGLQILQWIRALRKSRIFLHERSSFTNRSSLHYYLRVQISTSITLGIPTIDVAKTFTEMQKKALIQFFRSQDTGSDPLISPSDSWADQKVRGQSHTLHRISWVDLENYCRCLGAGSTCRTWVNVVQMENTVFSRTLAEVHRTEG